MNSKKKKAKNQTKDNSPIITVSNRPVFLPAFRDHLKWWYTQDYKIANKIMDLVEDILNGDPFTGVGKPEPLKYIDQNMWSRRINLEHRLVYKVNGDYIYFIQARYHYKK